MAFTPKFSIHVGCAAWNPHGSSLGIARPPVCVPAVSSAESRVCSVVPGSRVICTGMPYFCLNLLRILQGEAPDREYVGRVFEDIIYPLVTSPASGARRHD